MANTLFSGTSRYSSDFQSVITRAVSIAALPGKQMAQAKLKLSDEGDALRALDSKLAAVQDKLSVLEGSVGSNSFASSVSDASALRVNTSEGVAEGTYSVEVRSLGSYTTTISNGSAVANPAGGSITAATALTLEINDPDNAGGPISIAITPATNSLKSLVDEINTKAGSNVHAAMVNVGSTDHPNYQLSLQSTKLGAISLQLKDSGNLMDTTLPLGEKAEYVLNGKQLFSNTRNVVLAPSLTLDLLSSTGGKSATVSVSRNTANATSALNGFINAYNDVLSEVGKHRGNKDAALAGNSILRSIENSLRKVATSSGSTGAIHSLTDLGVYFDRNGRLYLDAADHTKATAKGFDAIKSFLGNSSSSGFLKVAKDALNGLEESENGIVKRSIAASDNAVKAKTARIEEEQTRIDRLTTDLQSRMAQVDATIAMLEQQVNYFNGMFAAMKSNSDSMQ